MSAVWCVSMIMWVCMHVSDWKVDEAIMVQHAPGWGDDILFMVPIRISAPANTSKKAAADDSSIYVNTTHLAEWDAITRLRDYAWSRPYC